VRARGVLALLALLTAGADFPDQGLTPGAVATTDVREVCGYVDGSSYSHRHRATTWKVRREILREYGVPRPFYGEIDHRVPLCLGGADAPPNLWPQDDFREKDRLEAETCHAVCRHVDPMPLDEAQGIFLGDWRDRLRRTR
jgi:hypothetical protein